MRFQSIAIVLLGFLITSAVLGQSKTESPNGLRGFSTSVSFQHDGKEYRYTLDSDAIKDTPSWAISDGEPPLSVVRAAEKGKLQLKKLIIDTGGWDIQYIQLQQADRKKWFYEIHFTCIEIGCSDKAAGGFTVLIKLDGVPVEPKVTKAPKTT